MNSSELPPAGTRHIVRRFVHDLNNAANCLHLELSLLEDDVTDPSVAASLDKMRRQVAQLETTIRSLAVRFAAPSACVVSAGDVFQSWRDKVDRNGDGPAFTWEAPASNLLINVDFNAVLSVLREICLFAGGAEIEPPRTARLYEAGDRVVFEILQPLDAGRPVNLNDALELKEWEHIVAASGGEFQCACDAASSQCVARMSFPKAASPPALFRDA